MEWGERGEEVFGRAREWCFLGRWFVPAWFMWSGCLCSVRWMHVFPASVAFFHCGVMEVLGMRVWVCNSVNG